MRPSNVRPPAVAVWLIDLLLPEIQNESVKGDLLEEFSDIVERFGESSARRWYWRHSTKTIAHLVFRTPWVVALAVLSGFFLIANVMGLVVEHKIMEDPPPLVTFLDRFGFWLPFGSMVIGLGAPTWMLAMIAKGKELVATTLFALMYVLSTVGAQVGVMFFHLLPVTPLPQPAFLALAAFLIVLVGIVVRQIRSIKNRRLARG